MDRTQLFGRLTSTLLPVLLVAQLISGCPRIAQAGDTLVAVAGNFTTTAQEIGTAFTEETGHGVRFSFGSTGKLFAQIAHGAPFEAFLAADAARPERAEAMGLAVPGSRFTYAVGRLVLFSADPDLIDAQGAVLRASGVPRLAIANPKTAPYGAAAVEVLRRLGVWESLAPRLVRGDNLAQTLQFVMTDNAPLGFVALAQLVGLDRQAGAPVGSRWPVPAAAHSPIRQDAVLLAVGADNPAAVAFLDFLRAPAAQAIIAGFGYGTE